MPMPIFHFTEIAEGMGEPAVIIDEAKYCDDCGQVHEFEQCPKCGHWIHLGFGLMFGGYGSYKYCQSDECDWFHKTQVEE